MSTTAWFILGLVAGANLGILLMAIMAVAKEEENAVSRRDASE